MLTKAVCHICRKGPYVLKNLTEHLRKVHRSTEEEVAEVKNALRRAKMGERREYVCEICGVVFFTSLGLKRHNKNKHMGASSTLVRTDDMTPVTCPECVTSFRCNEELARHCMEQHCSTSDAQNITEQVFHSWDSFELWIKEKEYETYTRFVRRTTRRLVHHTVYYFVCQHARGSENDVGPQEQKTRFKHSKRVTKHCPAFAKVKHNHDGSVHAKAYFGHLGHDISTATFQLSEEDEETVKEMVASGIPYRTVITDLRASHWLTGESAERQPRLCFLTMRDVANIAIRNNLVCGRTDENDITSLRALLKNPVIAASKLVDTQDPSGDGFSLAFITTNGKNYLQRYGRHGLILDDTFNVTKYSFRLATIAVADDAGNGFPCGHLISYRMTASEVGLLFELVKKCVPHLEPRYVMSDDTYVFYNAFKDAFPNTGAERIICSFHVSQTFQRKHKEILRGADVDIANRLFNTVLFQNEVTKFESHFAAYMTWLSTIGAADMISYVERNYSGRRKEWAICYHPNSHFMTSNHVEAWHRVLKHALLSSKQNGRLDNLTYTLLKHSEDRNLQLITSSVRGGPDASARNKRNIQQHKKALKYYREKPNAFAKIGEYRWSVVCESRTDQVYEIRISQEACDCSAERNSHCERCNICAFRVCCNCHEAYQSGVACIHAHALATFSEEVRQLFCPSRVDTTEDRVDTTQEAVLYSVSDAEAPQMYAEGSEDFRVISQDVLLQDEVKTAYQYSEGKLSQVGELLKKLRKGNDLELLKQCGDQLEALLQSVGSRFSPANTFSRRVEMQTTGVGPKPAKIQTFKTRFALNREKNCRRKLGERNIIEETRQILAVDRSRLQTCFVCGKRFPEGDSENVFWLSCTNHLTCKAWAHVSCTLGVGTTCSVCKEGQWQYEEVP